MVHSKQTFTAIIDCLCGLLPEAYSAERGSASDSTYRSQPERDALNILKEIILYSSQNAARAGLVSRWLTNYPFGGPDASLSRKREVLAETYEVMSCYDDNDFGKSMILVLEAAVNDKILRKEMMKVSCILEFPLS